MIGDCNTGDILLKLIIPSILNKREISERWWTSAWDERAWRSRGAAASAGGLAGAGEEADRVQPRYESSRNNAGN